jgi:4-aminobutyrate aminotransferase-like enzyme
MLPDSILPFLTDLAGKVQGCDAISPPKEILVEQAAQQIEAVAKIRGRALIYPMIPTGKGSGPYFELTDGSVKMDLITGIGVHLFGHNHPEMVLTALKHSLKCPTIQGTLMPGLESYRMLKLLVDHSKPSKISGGWLTTCGTMANELALKIVRQKKAPAWKLFSFKNTFAGRSTAMQELTDEPKYREGQPVFNQFTHIDFFNSKLDVQTNIQNTVSEINRHMDQEPNAYAGIEFEPVQGEGGGFQTAPFEWWHAILTHAKSRGLAVWLDEIQTFGRTGELFAHQTFKLSEFVDVVTCAKPLQNAAVLWTADYQPKPGLIAGTFSGSTVSLAVGTRLVEMLIEGNYFGPNGKIAEMAQFIRQDWETRRARLAPKFRLGEARIVGGMIAFEVLDGKAETVKKILDQYFKNGVVAFSAGRDPVMVRFLPPMGVLKKEHWLEAMDIFERTLEQVAGG